MRPIRHVMGVLQLECGIKVAEVIGESQRSRGDGRGESREEGYPSGHESPRGTEGLRQVNIFAAGAREIDAEFRIAKRAGQRADRAHSPDHKTNFAEPRFAREIAGGGQNAATDHVRNHQRRRAADPKLPQQRCVSRGQCVFRDGEAGSHSDCPPSHTYTAPVNISGSVGTQKTTPGPPVRLSYRNGRVELPPPLSCEPPA